MESRKAYLSRVGIKSKKRGVKMPMDREDMMDMRRGIKQTPAEERGEKSKKKGFTKKVKGKTMNFSSKQAYLNWVKHGQASGEFAKTPGNTGVKIRGVKHTVQHKSMSAVKCKKCGKTMTGMMCKNCGAKR